jgi:hypothetical protein
MYTWKEKQGHAKNGWKALGILVGLVKSEKVEE